MSLGLLDKTTQKYYGGEGVCGDTWEDKKTEAKKMKIGDLIVARDFFLANGIDIDIIKL